MTVTNPNSSGERSLIAHTQPTYLNSFKTDEELLLTRATITASSSHWWSLPGQQWQAIHKAGLSVSWPSSTLCPHSLWDSSSMSCGPTCKSCHSNEVGAEDALLSSITRWALSLTASQQDCMGSLTAWSVLLQPPPTPRNWGRSYPPSTCRQALKSLYPHQGFTALGAAEKSDIGWRVRWRHAALRPGL